MITKDSYPVSKSLVLIFINKVLIKNCIKIEDSIGQQCDFRHRVLRRANENTERNGVNGRIDAEGVFNYPR